MSLPCPGGYTAERRPETARMLDRKGKGSLFFRLTDFFFAPYRHADFVTRQRARVLFIIYIAILFIAIPFLTVSLTLHTVNPRAFIPPLSSALLIIVLIVIFRRGHLALSAHAFFIISLGGLWTAILSGNYAGHLIERTDTIVLILAMLTLTPLVVSKNGFVFVAYFVINGLVFPVFLNKIRTQMNIPDSIVIEYLIDNAIAYIFIGVVSYQIFSINKKAMERALDEIRRNIDLTAVLSEGEARFRALTENSTDLVVILTPDGVCIYSSPSVTRQHGHDREALTGKPFYDLIHPDDRETISGAIGTALRNENRSMPLKIRFCNADGSWRQMEGILTSMLETKGVAGIVLSLKDVTEINRDHEQLEKSLQEKETLLREIHHRVKNNFQIITSLLNLQARQISDEKMQSIFNDSQNRIRAMALIHEKLYGSGELAFINIGSYAETLGIELCSLYRGVSGPVALQTNSDTILLDIAQAIPCGLILNELITNALKHAFPADREGPRIIDIAIREGGGGIVVLSVSDNGIGIPAMKNGADSSSLGLQLLGLLAEGQLRGKVYREVDRGTCFRIEFPRE